MSWEQPDPGELLPLQTDAHWEALRVKYPSTSAQSARPLERCLEVLRLCGSQCVVIETRYLDFDYRSEYSAFFSKTFSSTPDSAHRLHFFRASLTLDQVYDLPSESGYLGYIVIRPTGASRVGRTMIPPPPDIASFIRTTVRDHVNLFGQDLSAEGVPFMQQDTQLGRCAHVAAWVCHYTGHLRGEVGRKAISDFALSIESGLGVSRPVPSAGLSAFQLLELLRLFELPPLFYNIENLPKTPTAPWANPDPTRPTDPKKPHPGYWDTRLFRICCRYLNSGFPILTVNADHAFVLSGYKRDPGGGGKDWITFYRHDDQRGPYLPVADVFNDIDAASGYSYAPWHALIVPLPRKLWLPPEPVEYKGGELLINATTAISVKVPSAGKLKILMASKQLGLRTYAAYSNRFKTMAQGRLSSDIAKLYRMTRFPRFIWVVEAVDRVARQNGNPAVLGEAIFDATSSEFDPTCLAWHVPGYIWIRRTDGKSVEVACPDSPYDSGGVGPL